MKRFINLSSGLEFLDEIEPDGYCRLQSSQLESAAFHRFLDSVDNGLLYAATKEPVGIYDCGSRASDGCSRVIWQGLPLIERCCRHAWGHGLGISLTRGVNVSNMFDEIWRTYKNKKKYRYFAKYSFQEPFFVGYYKSQTDFSYQ